jgi:tRNA A-37 threonylcarbamoyl transferase component Bud32
MNQAGGIFLSYARAQAREVEEIAVKLRAKGYPVFFDRKSLKGEVFADRIRSEIYQCRLFVFFVDSASLGKRSFALTELGYAEERWPNPDGHVLALALDEVDIAEVPPYLRALVNVISIRGNFAVGAVDRIIEALAAQTKAADSTNDATNQLPTIEECAERLVVALSNKRELPPGDRAFHQLSSEIDELVASIKSRFRPQDGDVVAGAKLVKVIGVGNFGVVWQGIDAQTQQPVAVKIFRTERLAEGQMLMRFRRSIRAMQILGEEKRLARAPEALGTIVGFVRADPSGLAFTMELLTGGNLDDAARFGWTIEQKLEILSRVMTAVAYSHDNGVIHRDIKPANIVLNSFGDSVLTDFDIADVKFATSMSTLAEGQLGTPIFAAPEQIQDADQADGRSDVYSLGRLLHYLLTGQSPGYVVERDPSLRDLAPFPVAIVEVVRKATQHDPQRRFQSVREMQQALLRCRSGGAALWAQASLARRWARHNWAVLVIGMILLGGGASGTAWQANVAIREAQYRRAEEEMRTKFEALSTRLSESIQEKDQTIERIQDLRAAVTRLERLEPSEQRDRDLRATQALLASAEAELQTIGDTQKELQISLEAAKRAPSANALSRKRATAASPATGAPLVADQTALGEIIASLGAIKANAENTCSPPDGTRVTAIVAVSFNASGDVQAVDIQGNAGADLLVGSCIRALVQPLHVHPPGVAVRRQETFEIAARRSSCGCPPADLNCAMHCVVGAQQPVRVSAQVTHN